jgi:hypothetical protein
MHAANLTEISGKLFQDATFSQAAGRDHEQWICYKDDN